jgi:hypothetical protein
MDPESLGEDRGWEPHVQLARVAELRKLRVRAELDRSSIAISARRNPHANRPLIAAVFAVAASTGDTPRGAAGILARSERVGSHLLRPPTLAPVARDLPGLDDRAVAVGLAGGVLGLQLSEREPGRTDGLEPADLD